MKRHALLVLSAGAIAALAVGCVERPVEYAPAYQPTSPPPAYAGQPPPVYTPQPAYTYQPQTAYQPAPGASTNVTFDAPAPVPAPATPPAAPPGSVIVAQSPPPPQVEVITVSPGPDYYWVPGYWGWNGGGWIWVGGRWSPRPWHGAVWMGGHWAHHGHGYIWVGGRWH